MKPSINVLLGIFATALLLMIGCETDGQDAPDESDEIEQQTVEEVGTDRPETDVADEIPGMYDRLAEMYEQMQRHYEEVEPGPDHTVESMQQIHRQMMHSSRHHEEMIEHGHGMMGEDPEGMMGDGPMHGRKRGMMDDYGMMHPETMAEWHEQMGDRQMHHSRQFESEEELREHHRQTARMHRQVAEMMHREATEVEPDEYDDEQAVGERIYAVRCASCHGTDGQGATGAFPPLNESPVVAGPNETLIRVVHDGLVGEIEVDEQRYDSVMPGFGDQLSDEQIAAVLAYVRSAWASGVEDVTPEDVREAVDPDQEEPWTAIELGIEAPRGE